MTTSPHLAGESAAASPTALVMGASYLVASVCFILTLQALSSPRHARKGVLLGCVGMAVAVAGTLLHPDIKVFTWIAIAALVGSVIGAAMSIWIPLTKMPERIAFSHAFGGLAAALVGVSEYLHQSSSLGGFKMGAIGLEVYFGFLTFTGSLMAFGKLQGVISGAPLTYKGQNVTNLLAFFGALGLLAVLVADPGAGWAFYAMCATGFALGILFVLPIGGQRLS